MAQHELVLRGYAPQHILVNASKALNTLLSMILVMMIYRLHWLGELFQRIRAHLRLLLPLNTSISPLEILCKPKFLALSLLNFLHLPPGVTFEFGVVNWDNFVLYRGETICMMFNTLRIFLFAQCFVHIFLFRLPRRHTVSSFTGVRMNSAFCFKEILNSDSALHVITIFWFIMLLVLGYWFRAVESTACLFGATVDKTSVGFASDFGSNSSLAGSPVLETTSLHEGCKVWWFGLRLFPLCTRDASPCLIAPVMTLSRWRLGRTKMRTDGRCGCPKVTLTRLMTPISGTQCGVCFLRAPLLDGATSFPPHTRAVWCQVWQASVGSL
jgi:hypothetical protein